jgi:hypothetical protein
LVPPDSDLGRQRQSALRPNIGPSPFNNGNGTRSDLSFSTTRLSPDHIEPYYFLYSNRYNSEDNRSQGLGTPKHSNQTRHNIGARIEMQEGNFDVSNETIYQFGQMGDTVGPMAQAMETKNSTSMPGH